MNDKVNSLEELAYVLYTYSLHPTVKIYTFFFKFNFYFWFLAIRSLKMMKGNLGLWKAKHFYVQDIFRRNLNISADITKDEIASFQKCCQLSCLMLKK